MATGHGTGQSSNDEIESQDHVHNDDISQNGTTSEPNRLPEQMAALSTNCSAEEVEAYALSLQKQCRTLLSELEEYQAYLKHKHVENNVEVRHFKNAITSEMKLLDRLAKADHTLPKSSHALRSTNLAFYAAVWSTAKNSASISAFRKRYYWTPSKREPNINGQVVGRANRQHSAVVDIIAQDGLEWIKVSYITEKRILWDLAKSGYAGDESSEEEEGRSDVDDEPEGLLKQAEALKKASRATRIRYRHPAIRLVLPRIKAQPDIKEVGAVLQRIRDLGIIVETMESVPATVPDVTSVLSQMVSGRFDNFTDPINVDCTILLAFASDLSHGRVESEDWHNQAIGRQIDMESQDQLLPSSLWPACGSRELVCTHEAAIRMQEIVAIIGTKSERRRTELILNLSAKDTNMTREERITEFQSLTVYTVPSNWQIPINVINVSIPELVSNLPPAAEIVAKQLTLINQSVFLYGWHKGLTTVSSNRSVAHKIENLVEAARGGDEELRGPNVWLTAMSRSLVGKEKQRRGFVKLGEGSDDGDI